MQPSRRAFLLGRSASRTPWQVFCQSLRRACTGELKLIQQAGQGTDSKPTEQTGQAPGSEPTQQAGHGPDHRGAADSQSAPQARWTPLSVADVRKARALCAEHGVLLALAGASVSTEGRPVLWVDPARLDDLVREPGPVPRWRAGPGVTLGELARAGLPQFAGEPPERTLAAWFADRAAAVWPIGRGDLSGVHAAHVLLADGVADTLGPFGADDGQPLRSAALQQLVPALFRMASGTEAQWCREQPAWPAHYRLDALLPLAPATLNLARMLHGHGGTLAWLEGLTLQVPQGDAPRTDDSAVAPPADVAVPDWTDARLPPAQARALNRRIKEAFDPAGIFPELA